MCLPYFENIIVSRGDAENAGLENAGLEKEGLSKAALCTIKDDESDKEWVVCNECNEHFKRTRLSTWATVPWDCSNVLYSLHDV